MTAHRCSQLRRAKDVLALVATVAAAWFLWPTTLGGSTRFITVEGRSMEPTYHLGDAVLADSNPHPKVGDVIVFHIPNDEPGAGALVIHRVHAIRADGSYETKGDNRTTADPFHITGGDIVGTPKLTLPRFGRLIGLSSSPLVIAMSSGLLTVGFLWPKKPRSDGDEAPSPFGHLAPLSPLELELAVCEARRDADEMLEWSTDQLEQWMHDNADLAAEANAWLRAELLDGELLESELIA